MTTSNNHWNDFFQLSCGVQNYPWGSKAQGDSKPPFIAEFIDDKDFADKPYAELWIGAHQKLPAMVSSGDGKVKLDQLINDYPAQILGSRLANQGVQTLPFLLKILSCEKNLSIQAHPDKELAETLHAKDPAHYPDSNHKPEIAIALTPFTALSQFRERHAIQKDIKRFSSLQKFFSAIPEAIEAEPRWLKAAYARIFEATTEEINTVLSELNGEIEELRSATDYDTMFYNLLEQFPNDRGCLSAYFLNIIHLKPGEAIYLPANEPHAYHKGNIIECMANSDNVVRAGLTDKFIDSEVLLDMLSYKEEVPHIFNGKDIEAGELLYQTPASEFKLQFSTHGTGYRGRYQSNGLCSIIIVTKGSIKLRTAKSGPKTVKKGTIWLWPAELEGAEITFNEPNSQFVRVSPNLVHDVVRAEPEDIMNVEETTEFVETDTIEEVVDSAEVDDTEEVANSAEVDDTEEVANSAEEITPALEIEPEIPEESFELDMGSMDMDFGALLDANSGSIKSSFRSGSKVTGVVSAIDRNSVFVDVGSRSDAVIDLPEFIDSEGNITINNGDKVEAFCVHSNQDDIRLTTKMTGDAADSSMQEAFDSGIPVEGKVVAERKGGYEVKIGHSQAFCPYSQMDIYRQEPATYIGTNFTFVISEYGENGRNIIVSRRKLLEQERIKAQEELKNSLDIGDKVTGKITRLMPFGAFVDLGSGIEGLIHVSELAWGRDNRAEDFVSAGDTVTVIVKDIDWQNERISLSLRQAQSDPWSTVLSDFAVGERYIGTITKLAQFGAFVQLIPGVEGLVHISKLGAEKRVYHPQEVCSVGDEVEVKILEIEIDKRRMSLSMEEEATPLEEVEATENSEALQLLKTSERVIGTVESIKNFGIFINLPDKRTGLLHISQIELKGSSNPGRAMFKMFPPDSKVEVIIKDIDGNRISLTLPETLERESEKVDLSQFSTENGKGGLGSLGDLFGGLKL